MEVVAANSWLSDRNVNTLGVLSSLDITDLRGRGVLRILPKRGSAEAVLHDLFRLLGVDRCIYGDILFVCRPLLCGIFHG